MRQTTRFAIAAVIIGGAGICAAVPALSASQEDAIARGRALVQENCARCHAVGMDDSSAHEEAPPFRVVVTRYPPQDLAEALAEGISSGHPDMPEFVFEPADVDAIITYLDSLTPRADAQE
jgi:cytochrome c